MYDCGPGRADTVTAEPLTGSPCRIRARTRSEEPMRELASIQSVYAVEPIPNADVIERVRVLGWWVVAKKGEHK
jgi:hypothetical protein